MKLKRETAKQILEETLKEFFPLYDSGIIDAEDFDLSKQEQNIKEEIVDEYITICSNLMLDKTGYGISHPEEWDFPEGQEPDVEFNHGRDLMDYVLSEAEGVFDYLRESRCCS